MGGTYTLGADGIYYPNLVSTDEEPHYGKYGMMWRTYLKEHRPEIYSIYYVEEEIVLNELIYGIMPGEWLTNKKMNEGLCYVQYHVSGSALWKGLK